MKIEECDGAPQFLLSFTLPLFMEGLPFLGGFYLFTIFFPLLMMTPFLDEG